MPLCPSTDLVSTTVRRSITDETEATTRPANGRTQTPTSETKPIFSDEDGTPVSVRLPLRQPETPRVTVSHRYSVIDCSAEAELFAF